MKYLYAMQDYSKTDFEIIRRLYSAVDTDTRFKTKFLGNKNIYHLNFNNFLKV